MFAIYLFPNNTLLVIRSFVNNQRFNAQIFTLKAFCLFVLGRTSGDWCCGIQLLAMYAFFPTFLVEGDKKKIEEHSGNNSQQPNIKAFVYL